MKHLATWIAENEDKHFPEAFPPGDYQLYNARYEAVPWEKIDGLVLAGGSDISGPFLRQPVPDPAILRDPDPPRDEWDFAAFQRARAVAMPILAICRGHQVMNVALGGTLLLDIPGHNTSKYDNVQPLRYEEGVSIQVPRVNSSHHQAIDRLGEGLEVQARHAEDGTVEQVRLRDYPFALGVQFHPERDRTLYAPIFDAFRQAMGD